MEGLSGHPGAFPWTVSGGKESGIQSQGLKLSLDSMDLLSGDPPVVQGSPEIVAQTVTQNGNCLGQKASCSGAGSKKKKISVSSEKGETLFDRILDLSGSLEEKRDYPGWEWEVPSKSIPDAWPLQCLLPPEGEKPAILLQGRQREDKISFSVLACARETQTEVSTVKSILSEKMCSVREDSLRLVAQAPPVPMIQIEDAKPSPWRKRSPYLHTRGTFFRMMDPTRIPFLTDDWIRQLFYTLMQR